jgi:hypothetical protein
MTGSVHLTFPIQIFHVEEGSMLEELKEKVQTVHPNSVERKTSIDDLIQEASSSKFPQPANPETDSTSETTKTATETSMPPISDTTETKNFTIGDE